MRFISPIKNYRQIVLHQKTEPLADGTRRVISEGYTAEFRQSDTTDWERDVARRELTFRGTTLHEDGTPVDPINRVSSFDTDSVHAMDCRCPRGSAPVTASCEKLKKQVEEALLKNDDYGKRSEGYILVEKPKLPAPWPTYDELVVHGQRKHGNVAKQNIETAKTTGVSLEHLIAYERQERNDPRIIEAYEAALAEAQVLEPEPDLVEA